MGRVLRQGRLRHVARPLCARNEVPPIFTNDGFLGDLPLVNFAYAPYFEVLPRKYRFRILNACMSRFLQLALSWNGAAVPFKFIANDGNFVVNPIELTSLDEGIAERYDIVIDFSMFRPGEREWNNALRLPSGRRSTMPSGRISSAQGQSACAVRTKRHVQRAQRTTCPSSDASWNMEYDNNRCTSGRRR